MKKLITKIKFNRKYFLLGLLILVVAVIILPQTVNAADSSVGATLANTIKFAAASPILLALGVIASLVIVIFGAFNTIIIGALVNLVQYNNFINEPSITAAWIVVRDLCNMFFILILLVIAFATILRLPNYEWKKLLPKLLIMAVLINFSRTICGLIIDASQVIMLTFVNAWAGGGNFVSMLGMANYFTGVVAKGFTTWDWSVLNVVAGMLIGIMFLIISGIVLLVALSVFLMRVIMLWILIVLSPFAFLAAAFPAGQKYATQWWTEFVKYILNGPALAFFIWLALITSKQITDSGSLVFNNPANANQCFSIIQGMCMNNFMPFILSIGMLVGGLMITQQIGGIGSGIAGKGLDWAKKVGGAPLAAVGGVTKFGFFKAGRITDTLQMKGQGVIAKGISRLTGGVFGKEYQAKSLNYRMIAEGWKRNQAVKMRDYEGTKAGAWQDQFNRTLSASLGMPVVSRIMESRAGKKINNLENGVIVNGEIKERGKLQINEEISGLKNKKESAQTDEERAAIQKSIEAREGEIRTINKEISDLRKVDWRIGRQPLQKYARLEEQQKANEEYTNIGKEDINEEGLVNKFETEGRIDKKRGYLMRLADINGLNTLFADMGQDMTAQNIRKFYEDQFGAAAGDVAAEVSRRAEAVGNYKLIGFHKFDVAKNRNVLASPEEQENYAMKKDKERYAQNHGRTTHFDSLVDRYADGRKELSSIGTRQLLQIASNEGRMKEIRNGNYQTRYGEMVIELKPQIENKIQEFKASGKTAEADGLQTVLNSFITNYGALKVQKKQEKDEKGSGEKEGEKTNEAEDESSSD